MAEQLAIDIQDLTKSYGKSRGDARIVRDRQEHPVDAPLMLSFKRFAGNAVIRLAFRAVQDFDFL